MSANKLINIEDLNLCYKENSQNKILQNINFYLYENEIVSIIGESGSGKTTLAKYIMGLDRDRTIANAKKFLINNKEINSNISEFNELYGKKISMILQDPIMSLNPTLKIGEQFKILLKEKYKNISNIEIYRNIEDLFKEVNLNNYEEIIKKYPAELSGGMNQRINIALSLIKEPEILIMDEPTSAIDFDNRMNLVDLIKRIQQQRRISIIFITHDLILAQKIADRIIVMQNGRIIEESIKENDEFRFSTNYTKDLYESAQLNKNIENRNIGNSIIEFNNVSKKFRNNTIIKNLSFNVFNNEILGIVGKSGSGKTTICKLIMGIYKQNEGTILIQENAKIEMVYQNANMAINPNLNIYKILNEENYIKKRKKYNKEEIEKYLKDFNLPYDVLEKKTYQLSGGQRQIISIIRALLNLPNVLILDEPTSSLDVLSQKKLLDLLKSIKQKYHLTYIIISHDEKVIEYMCDRHIVLK